ncbi:MAG TPA: hypothetical protein VHO70_06015 [Chitinispirillaceae bacterium]|nr:hypothetical protein [Chitinispirillaceae bacterium]
MKLYVRMSRLMLSIALLLLSVLNAQETKLQELTREFASMYGKLSKLASPSVSSMGVDSAGMLLSEVKKRVKGVQSVLRINSSGTVINEIVSSGAVTPMRSVADQKWFLDVREMNKAYFGTTREAGMNYLLFWAWPIQSGSGGFGGVLAVKLDVASICQEICLGDSAHFAAFYNENLLYRCGNDRYSFRDESEWVLPDTSKIILRYGAAVINGTNEVDEKPAVETENEPVADVVEEDKAVSKNNKEDGGSREQTKTTVRKSGGSNLLLYLLLIAAVVSGYLLLKAKFGKRLNSLSINNNGMPENLTVKDAENNSEESQSQTLNTEMVDIDENENVELMDEVPDETHEEIKEQNPIGPDIQNVDTANTADCPLSAEEACEKIKALIEDRGAPFQDDSVPSVTSSTNDELRRELYREIHGQVMHWVTCESLRLSQSLKELSDRVGKLENVNNPEVMRIRSEANRISKEISAFKDNPSGQVLD